jgi:hypothetical protein
LANSRVSSWSSEAILPLLGASTGWQRAHKHIDTPDAETIEEQIVTAVLNEVCQYFDFDDA